LLIYPGFSTEDFRTAPRNLPINQPRQQPKIDGQAPDQEGCNEHFEAPTPINCDVLYLASAFYCCVPSYIWFP
ncbi:unnamed protein product, partial [Heterosigma akashiwo]